MSDDKDPLEFVNNPSVSGKVSETGRFHQITTFTICWGIRWLTLQLRINTLRQQIPNKNLANIWGGKGQSSHR